MIDIKYLEKISKQYDIPYNVKQIRANYPKQLADKLLADPVHRWRAETGIEVIHPEPSLAEQERVYANWQLMTEKQKELSDKKSIELFNIRNQDHYKKIMKEKWNK